MPNLVLRVRFLCVKKRGGAGLELRSASSCEAKRREFKFDIFRVRVSAAQICKFERGKSG